MPLMILGLFFAVGIFAYYMIGKQAERSGDPHASSGASSSSSSATKKDSDLRTHDNVIFLPENLEQMKKDHRNKKS